MQKPQKDFLRTLITELRHTLLGWWDDDGRHHRGDLDRELERLGIAPDGTITPLDALRDPGRHERRTRAVAEAQLAALTLDERPAMRAEIVERAGYTWINRLLALRAMEARGLTEETMRPNPAYGGISEALYILRQTQPQRTTGPDGGWWAVLTDACQAQADALPGLFDLEDPNTALRPSIPALVKCIALVGGDGGRLDEVFRDPDAIGWAYQFYQEENKARTYEKLGSGGKVETRAEIAAVTQLFTEPYMVKWLLQNSLGRSYHELYTDSRLPETWDYYIRRSEDGDQRTEPPGATCLEELTFMDPCMGSGHFEREVFDMLAAMYRERYPDLDATAIADRVLSGHLHGIDIDPRAAQLAALTLYLRAWEGVQVERRARRMPVPGLYKPPALNLATTPGSIPAGALERHLQRHPEDGVYEPLLRGVFAALEQAHLLGSLLKPEEHLDQAIAAFRRTTSGGQYGLLDESAAANQLLEELGKHDPEELKRILLERVGRGFAAEAGERTDVGASLFGREAVEGVHLLQLLGQKYAVVATNPPYMGSSNMDDLMRLYVERHYESGKRDLYASFISRCVNMTLLDGRLAMITQQSWMFLKSYSDLRSESPGLVRNQTIESLVHLGRYAFSDIGNAIVAPVMFIVRIATLSISHNMWACRLVAPKPSDIQKQLLLDSIRSPSPTPDINHARQSSFLALPNAPLMYWLSAALIANFGESTKLGSVSAIPKGFSTAENARYLRYFWEVVPADKWVRYAKGGGYRKWIGLEWYVLKWGYNGAELRAFPRSVIRNEHLVKSSKLTYSEVIKGCLGVRTLEYMDYFDARSPAIIPSRSVSRMGMLGLLNSRAASYFFRCLSPALLLDQAYAPSLPVCSPDQFNNLENVAELAWALKHLITTSVINEARFEYNGTYFQNNNGIIECLLHAVEGIDELLSFDAYAIGESDRSIVVEESGTPAGWHPLISGYDNLPDLPADLDLPPLPQEVLDYLPQHECIDPDREELARIKANLQALYEAGPGAKADDLDLEEMEHAGDDEEMTSGAYIPIPTETFLEELSVNLQIHPISVYWLLEELRAEGVRCKPEEQRLLEDRLTVIVLRLLGHRWPKQIEEGEPVPFWADPDGIIPLTPGSGDTPLAERLRARLRVEDGPLGSQQAEALLQELTGRSLEEWLRRDFFKRYVRQFKKRPISWHLASTPTASGGRRRRSNRQPAFECFVYYHACSGDVLARIRTQYVEPLLAAEQGRVARARRDGDETAAATAVERIHELENFAERLLQVEESGFACADLDDYLDQEPLDRWSGDGVFAPASRAELRAAEQAWQVDINDGVRVNIAPLQQAGLLTSNVLSAKDMRKAIADRARWRSDERRWVREGKLPRCGWLPDDVPESPRWTELALEREAERQRLEAKRRKLTDNQ
ncbi:MAG: BREX-1 system adenine-specific DNA-methyltransferase PglX [Chloroflexi bacterium]|nr:BREX-1 system adenine-specific DNA-methyltransferase PglX [Chloroflexota bacterium]